MITFIVATLGRPSLAETLASIEVWPGDDVLVIGAVPAADRGAVRFIPCPPGGDWGSTERNIATRQARGRYLAHIDDDDVYAPGARARMADAIAAAPQKLTIFRMQFADGGQLWRNPVLERGNVGTPMLLMPNDPAKLGQWGEHQDCGDFHFLLTMGWTAEDIAWREDVIAHVSQVHA